MPDMTNESITVRLSEWHRLQDENRAAVERIAEIEQLLAARPQEECAQRLTLQSDGSLRCHHCGHVVPKFESKR